jgi:anti-sigma factor RsiW
MSNTSTTCRDFVASIGEYQSGEMEPRRRAIFANHLSHCDQCSAYLKSYDGSVKLAKDSYAAGSDDLPEELVGSIMASHRKRKSQ